MNIYLALSTRGAGHVSFTNHSKYEVNPALLSKKYSAQLGHAR
jgi:hypothetical protein